MSGQEKLDLVAVIPPYGVTDKGCLRLSFSNDTHAEWVIPLDATRAQVVEALHRLALEVECSV